MKHGKFFHAVPLISVALNDTCLCACLLSIRGCMQAPMSKVVNGCYLVDPASSHMLVSKIKPCMSKYKLLYGETANGSLKQL